ncbi:MAG: dTDP-4-dehydrorhamnose reductase [Chlamydiota bacterium]
MKLWIIGKRGMLARAFQRICTEKKVAFVATSHKEVDLCDQHAVKAQFATLDFTHIVNCAGYTAVDRAEEEQEKAYALNVEAVELLAKLAAKHKKRLIHFSTDYVFDGEQEDGYPETAFPRPISIYGKTKEEGERRVLQQNPHACVIRTSWLFDKEGSNFVTTMRDRMQKEKQIQVVSDQRGRPTFCDDLVEATLRLVDAEGVFHFANRGTTSRYEWACAILAALKEKGEVTCHKIIPISSFDIKRAAKRPRCSVLETEKYEKRMAISPRHWKQPLLECLH